jgi:hypothetical protein
MHPQDLILAPPTLKPRPAQPDWPEVLTDWCAIRALEQAGVPIILQNAGEVQAAFISEVSAYLRFRALHLREAHAEACFDAVAETTLSEMGGPAYRAARAAFEATQGAFLKTLVRTSCESGNPVCDTLESEDATRLRTKLQECERELSLHRRRVEPSVRLARRRAAQTYWAAVAQCRMPEDFFRDAPRNSMLAEMPFHCATWWGLYVCWLGRVVARSNPGVLPPLAGTAAAPSGGGPTGTNPDAGRARSGMARGERGAFRSLAGDPLSRAGTALVRQARLRPPRGLKTARPATRPIPPCARSPPVDFISVWSVARASACSRIGTTDFRSRFPTANATPLAR